IFSFFLKNCNMQTQVFVDRRHRLLSQMKQGVAIIATAPEKIRNRDVGYPYRFDSYFYYLTGFREPEAVLVLINGGDDTDTRQILFCRDKDTERELWEGFRHGLAVARAQYQFDESYAINRLDELMPDFLANQPVIFYA